VHVVMKLRKKHISLDLSASNAQIYKALIHILLYRLREQRSKSLVPLLQGSIYRRHREKINWLCASDALESDHRFSVRVNYH